MAALQFSLFGRGEPRIDAALAGRRRLELANGAWVDHLPGWLLGHDAVFRNLERTSRWQEQRRMMYQRLVEVPRLVARLPEDGPGDPIIPEIQAALASAYGEPFERVSLALYRNGQDSVAWHGDQVARELPESRMATVSLGSPRRFLMRPKRKGAGETLSFDLGWGDLLVMGGTSQRTWEHCVPKRRRAEPRLVMMLRPRWEGPAPSPGEVNAAGHQ